MLGGDGALGWQMEPLLSRQLAGQATVHYWGLGGIASEERLLEGPSESREHKLESRLLGEISITSDMQMTPPLWQKVKRNEKAS